MDGIQIVTPRPPLRVNPSLQAMLQTELIQQAARRAFIEFTSSISFLIPCSFYLTRSINIFWFGVGLSAQTFINSSARFIRSYAEFQMELEPGNRDFPWIHRLTGLILPLIYTGGTLVNFHSLIHEWGHAIAIKILFENPSLEIEIYPFMGGKTIYNGTQLSNFGNRLGSGQAVPIVSAAGPLFASAINAAVLAAGLPIQKKFPEIGRLMVVSSLVNFLSHFLYALAALGDHSNDLSQDFVSLKRGGIHPLASAVSIAAIPTLVYLGYRLIQRCRSE